MNKSAGLCERNSSGSPVSLRLLTNRPRSSALSFLVSANPSAAYHCLPDPGRQNKKKGGGS